MADWQERIAATIQPVVARSKALREIAIGSGVIASAGAVMRRHFDGDRVLVFCDEAAYAAAGTACVDALLSAGYKVKTRILPALDEARPDLIIISAGFDAHHRDPLAEINLVADDFDWATGKLMDIAGRYSGNRVVSLLEGGYDLVGLAESAAAHVIRLQEG